VKDHGEHVTMQPALIRPSVAFSRWEKVARWVCCLLIAISCSPSRAAEGDIITQIDAALARGGAYLVARQNDDGAWTSDVYPTFRSGTALTPMILRALNRTMVLPDGDESQMQGLRWLQTHVAEHDSHGEPLDYPVYAASNTLVLLCDPPCPVRRKTCDGLVAMLRKHQLAEHLGWHRDDSGYGGWGYAQLPPRKPAAGTPVSPLAEANLSATVYALEALSYAGVRSDDPMVCRARVFVERCQNFGEDPAYDDGGFYFVAADPVRNKAGVAGRDEQGRERFVSYGSTTADGLRALLLCGEASDSPRVEAARRWLNTRFDPAVHPGAYSERREAARQSPYYYYAHSLTDAWLRLPPSPDTTAQARALAEELISRQAEDGSWKNSAVDVREDDLLVATPMALLALRGCLDVIARETR
jgi:hypothetical protein